MAVDPDYLERIQKTVARFDEYMRAKPGTPRSESFPTWARQHVPQASADRPIAYFCAEYGIHESLHLYAGGLGILAGDHLKSASDLGIPLVAIGLLYRQGYFRQRVNVDGWQEEFYSDEDFRELPLTLLRDETNQPVIVEVPIRGRSVCAQIWRAEVGPRSSSQVRSLAPVVAARSAASLRLGSHAASSPCFLSRALRWFQAK